LLDATQLALKILLNSFYGYSGYARARLYSLTLASAVTSFGRENILRTKKLIEEDIKEIILKDGRAPKKDEMDKIKDGKHIGLSVVYGDTDSVFVHLLDKELTFDEAQLVGNIIANTVTDSLVKPMELVFDSFARRAIFIAKKRYALLILEKTAQGMKEKIKVKGMETVRRDWCDLTTNTVEKVLELVLIEGKVDDAKKLVENTINRIRIIDPNKDPKLFDELILTRQYTKKPESYRSWQPHITVVEKLKDRGIIANIGDRIPFVIIDGLDMFVERAEDPDYAKKNNLPLDVDYYIKKQIRPPVDRILSDLGELGGNISKATIKKPPPEKQYDVFELAEETYANVRDLLKKEGKVDDAVNLVKSTIDSIREIDSKKNPELFKKLIIKKRYIRKTENSKSRQPSIFVIEKMRMRGKSITEGDKVSYVMLAGDETEFQRAEDSEYAKEKNLPLDDEYYTNKQILSMVEEKFSEYSEFQKKLKTMREQRTKKGQRSLFEY
jgi:DNA polymerase I